MRLLLCEAARQALKCMVKKGRSKLRFRLKPKFTSPLQNGSFQDEGLTNFQWMDLDRGAGLHQAFEFLRVSA